MRTSIRQNTASTPEQIASTAYTLWEQAGRPTGRDMEFWLKAEQQIAKSTKPEAAPASTTASTAKTSSSGTDTASKPPTSEAGFEWVSRSGNQTEGRSGGPRRSSSTRERRTASI